MDAAPLLTRIAELLEHYRLEAVLIGNAAAALHGAPVTTIDFDFFFRRTPSNLKKLKDVARALEAVVMRPYYPVSGMFRVTRERDHLQIDFMTEIDGVRSFEGLRKRSTPVRFGASTLDVASLPDIIKSKRAAARPQDRAVLEILEKTLAETQARHEKSSPGSTQEGK